MEDEEIIFQEEEVVWAKIRGYPWWPAFINDLHQNKGQTEYTVVFFGDNTNARLDGSKLRKFLECYIECYNKAKTHRKLMSAILMAEQNLKQNDQDVQIFEDMKLKSKNKKKSARNEEEHSEEHVRLGAEESKGKKQVEIYQQSSQIKEKSEGNETGRNKSRRTRGRALMKNEKQPANQKNQSEVKDTHNNKQSNAQTPALIPKAKDLPQLQQLKERRSRQSSISIMREVDIVINLNQNKKSPIIDKVQNQQQMQTIKISEQKPEKQQIVEQLEKQKGKQQKIEEQPKMKEQMDVEQEQQQSQEEPSEIPSQQRSIHHKRKTTDSQKSRKEPVQQVRKRGRPKKTQQIIRQKDQSFSQQISGRPDRRKKKIIAKPALQQLQKQQKPTKMSINNQTIINGVQRLLQKREELIAFLLKSTITVDNVKQILDMDVSNILQEGPITDQIIYLLELLRAALLYKYFPEDIKHRKKFQRLSKKKPVQVEQQKQQQNGEKAQIRRKTLMKIRKFLAGIDQSEQKVSEISNKIEQYIYKADNELSKRYCRIAFLVLSALKDKRQTYQQILDKLESKLYD